MKNKIKLVLLLLLSLGLITACSSTPDEPTIDDMVGDEGSAGEIPSVEEPNVNVGNNSDNDGDNNIDVGDDDVIEDSDDPFADVEGDVEGPEFGEGFEGGQDTPSTPKNDLEEIALRAIEGRYGKGATMERKIKSTGYSLDEVKAEMERINKVLSGSISRPNPNPDRPSNGGNTGGNTGGGSGGSQGNTTPEIDRVAPVIRLQGQSTITIKSGKSFIDPGVVITDNKDSNLRPTITFEFNGKKANKVDTNKVGTYTIYYNASDRSGNKAKQVSRKVKVEQNIISVISVDKSQDITINYGESYTLPGITTIELSNNKRTSVPIQWEDTVNVTKPGEYKLKGKLDLSNIKNIESTKLTAEVSVIVGEPIIKTGSISSDRIFNGEKNISEVSLSTENGYAKLRTLYMLDKDSYINGASKNELDSQNTSRLGHQSLEIKTPRDIEGIDYVELHITDNDSNQTYVKELDVISTRNGKVVILELAVARKVDSLYKTTENGNNWAPVNENKYRYEVKWYNSNKDKDKILLGDEGLVVEIENDFNIKEEYSTDKFLNELRKERKTSVWFDDIENVSLANSRSYELYEIGFHRPFIVDNDINTIDYKVIHYYDENKTEKTIDVEVKDSILFPIKSGQSNYDNTVKNVYWYENLPKISDNKELPDVNSVGSYYPFRIMFDEKHSSESIFFIFDNKGELVKKEIELLPNEIFGLEKETDFFNTEQNISWYTELKEEHMYESKPSVYSIGAYEGFILTNEAIDTNKTAKGFYHFYDKNGKLKDREFLLLDGEIPVIGDQENFDKIERNEEWFASLPELSREEGEVHPVKVGAYRWFKVVEDKPYNKYERYYKAYYYELNKELFEEEGELTPSITIHGTQEEMNNTEHTRNWWENETIKVTSLEDDSAGWQEIGAYRWFRVSDGTPDYSQDPLTFTAYYYTNEKDLITVEGGLVNLEIEIKGTQASIDSVTKDSSWFEALPEYSATGFETHWYHVGAYKVFRQDSDNVPYGDYKAYYYDNNREVVEIQNVLEDPIVLHGTEEELLQQTKNSEWWNSVERLEDINSIEASWRTIGAYKFFTIENKVSELPDANHYIAYYYDENKSLNEITGELEDGIPIHGTQDEIDSTVRNLEWWQTIAEYENESVSGWETVGAYKWFKRISDEDPTVPYATYKAYYYTDQKELMSETDELVDEIDLGGRTIEDINIGTPTETWWNELYEVDSLNTLEGSWLSVGAYKWFKVMDDYENLSGLEYKVYYYGEDKRLNEMVGTLEEEIIINGTLEDMQNTKHTLDWWKSIYSFETHEDVDWRISGAYQWFKVAADDRNDFETYIAYYFDENKELQMVSDTMEDEIAIHGTQQEMIDTVKTEDWFNNITIVSELNTEESSWITQGAYSWFRLENKVYDPTDYPDGIPEYTAYYYTDRKQLMIYEGDFESQTFSNNSPWSPFVMDLMQ